MSLLRRPFLLRALLPFLKSGNAGGLLTGLSSLKESGTLSTHMEREQVRRILKARLLLAQERRSAAAKTFNDAVRVPSRIPHSCGAGIVRAATQEYRKALADVQKAIKEQTEFLLRDVVPDDLKPGADNAPAGS